MNQREIFSAALAIADPSERAAYLDRVCYDDPAQRREIEELLQAQVRLGAFLECPPPGMSRSATLDESITEPLGTMVGPYTLLQEIGQGGMGVVFMAEQSKPVRRKVALKIIKPGMDTRQVIARFAAERQALSLMDHPNIAKVLDAGATESGRPYFVMELVQGQPITEYCDDRHLMPRQRLELLVPVCHAIQHAHQKGIIHRDIKPSNILVTEYDEHAVAKVIDFGVAKAISQPLTEKTLFTGLGQIVGTLEYMSPEQAKVNQLDIDTRSDIYSLGVLMYELLTGSTPFDKQRLRSAAWDEMLRIIREEEPPRPSTKLSSSETLPSVSANRNMEPARLSRTLRGELDWIVMKALEKDRNRRYETANGLAMDIQRHLADEPVEACPPSALYRARKFARRNKGGLAAGALLSAALLVSVSGIGWAVRDRAAQRAQRLTRTATQVELILADVNARVEEQKWDEALASAKRADAAIAGGEADAATVARVFAMVKDLEFVDRLGQIREDQSTWISAERTFDKVGTDRAYAEAFRAFGVDVATLPVETSIARLQAHSAIVVPVAAALDHWVSVATRDEGAGWQRLVKVARGIDPDPLRDNIRAILESPNSESHADELEQLAQSLDVRSQRAATVSTLADELTRMKHSDAAQRLLRKAQAAHPGDFWLNFQLAKSLADQQDRDGAIQFYTAATAIRPRTAAAYNNLGIALFEQNKLEAAIAIYRKCIELDPNLSYAYVNLGMALDNQDKREEAIAAYRKAIEVDPEFAYSHTRLGMALADQKLDEAISAYRKAIELDPKSSFAYTKLGRALAQQRKFEEALAAYRSAVEIDPNDGVAQYYLADTLSRLGRLDEVADLYRKAVEVEPRNAQAHRNLGTVMRKLNRYEDALVAHNQAIVITPQDPWVYVERGRTYGCMGEWQMSAADYDQGLRMGDASSFDAWVWSYAGVIRLQVGNVEGYREACRELVEHHGQTDELIVAKLIARTCSLAPDSVADFKQIEQILPRLAPLIDNTNWEDSATQGLVHYRAGRFDVVIQVLERISTSADQTHWHATALATLAMALQRTGREAEGSVALSRAQQILAKRMPEVLGDAPSDSEWTHWLQAQILVSEARNALPGFDEHTE